VTLMSGAMMAPALAEIGGDLAIGDEQTQMSLSIFVLSFAFGPIFLAPLSEVFGRKKVWMSSGCWYILWNTVCGFAGSNALMIVARAMAGFGASAEFAVSCSIAMSYHVPLLYSRSND
jgi:MFS family permease